MNIWEYETQSVMLTSCALCAVVDVYDRLVQKGKKPGFFQLLATQTTSAVWHVSIICNHLSYFCGWSGNLFLNYVFVLRIASRTTLLLYTVVANRKDQ
jgi:hypothetical protein